VIAYALSVRIWLLLILGACSVSNYIALESQVGYSSDVAAGAEVFVTGNTATEAIARPAAIGQLVLSPDGIATARRIDDHTFAIQTLAPGMLHVHAVVNDDDEDLELHVVPATIGPMRVGTESSGLVALPPAVSPRPTEIGVYAPHHVLLEEPIVDANHQPLTGHTIEPWAPQDRLLPVQVENSPPNTQFELIPDAAPVAVSVGGETISFVAVEPHSATRLVLADENTGTIYDGTTAIPVPMSYDSASRLVVLAYDANDRLLVGEDLTVTPASSTIEAVTISPTVRIYGNSPGTSSVTVTYDGLTLAFPVATP
jgi:hypothetical protein